MKLIKDRAIQRCVDNPEYYLHRDQHWRILPHRMTSNLSTIKFEILKTDHDYDQDNRFYSSLLQRMWK